MTGEELKTLRQERGLSRARLADEVGVSEQTIWRWETGRTGIGGPEERAIRGCLKAPERED
ncbi:hypothetical protein LCGC14_1495880 [marine sediment metagenome]|uniref:HTH cro/C1-type domain-containing protein n=1 Tax=marine sediment metagenome TaxID=412755 RepID=A0A0F9J612_9ZZZZ